MLFPAARKRQADGCGAAAELTLRIRSGKRYNSGMSTIAAGTNQAEIFRRVLELQGNALTPEVAQFFLQLELPAEDRARLDELAALARQGTLSPSDHADLDEFRRFGRLVELMKLKARKSLQVGG